LIVLAGWVPSLALAASAVCSLRPPEVLPPPPLFGERRPDGQDICPPDRVRISELPVGLGPPAQLGAAVDASPDCEPQGCWAWAGWGDRRRLRGAAARLEVSAPLTPTGAHSSAEVVVRGGPELRDLVEIGWTVAPRRHPDGQPHLLVQRWIDGQPCEGPCGFRPWSSAFAAGMSLAPWVGRTIHVGWLLWEGRWWAWFEGGWLGWYEAALWEGQFVEGNVAQWFGEVLLTPAAEPVVMGNGRPGEEPGAARFSQVCDVPPSSESCVERSLRTPRVSAPHLYSIHRESPGAFRYGGSGRLTDLTPPRPPSSTSEGTPAARETSGASPPR
jgi:hypothetical protein